MWFSRPCTASTKSRFSRQTGSPCAAHGAAPAHVHHDVVFADLQCHAIGKDVQADPMVPPQQAGGRQVSDRTAGKAQRGGRRGGHGQPLEIVAVAAGVHVEDLGHVAGQEAGGVDHMGCLFDHLAAAAVLVPPPLRRRRLVQLESLDQMGQGSGPDAVRLIHRVQIAPVIAHGGDQPSGLDLRRNLLGHGDVQGEGLFDEERRAARDAGAFGRAWAKGGTRI